VECLHLQHRFFQESCSSKDNPKHDWYFWKDPKFNERGERIPPNNWEANFGGAYTPTIYLCLARIPKTQVPPGHGKNAVGNIVSFGYLFREHEV
jgi:hypothetical protein